MDKGEYQIIKNKGFKALKILRTVESSIKDMKRWKKDHFRENDVRSGFRPKLSFD